jgi:hypothetical protein
MLDNELDQAIAEYIRQWNIAERRIKKAEQVRANEVVASAIFELRYAGRKIVDALDLILKTDISTDKDSRTKVHSYIADATERLPAIVGKPDGLEGVVSLLV